MSLRFIIGRAGVGKTRLCLEELSSQLREHPLGKPLLLIVPEQATFQMEQAMLSQPGIEGFARLHIVSFRRLARMVCSEIGGTIRPQIDEAGRRMLLRSLLHRRRGQLHVFARESLPTGLVERIANTLAELRTHGYGPDDVRAMAADLPAETSPVLKYKLTDLAVIYEDYLQAISPGYTDVDGFMNEAAANMQRIAWLQDVQAWVDGFAGFTPMEYRMLGALLRVAARVSVSLCLDPRLLHDASAADDTFFQRPFEAYHILTDLARRAEVELETPVVLEPQEFPRFQSAPVLAHIEKHWDAMAPQPYAGSHGSDQLALRVARNRADEVQAVAAEIMRLCRTRKYRFRDIAVLARDLDAYADIIAEVFSDCGIPYFLDQRRPITFHPLVRTLVNGLKAVLQRYDTPAVLRFLKTDMAPVARDEVDRLENYALKHGITGAAWWDKRFWDEPVEHERASPSDMRWERWLLDRDAASAEHRLHERREINAVRLRGLMPLKRLETALRNSDAPLTRRRAAQVLWDFLVDLDAAQTIARWIAAAEAKGDMETVSTHQQVWEGILTVLEGLAAVLPEVVIDAAELLAMLEEGCQSLRLGLIPPSLDQVLVGAVDRTRHSNVRATFLLGAVDRQFPQVPSEDMVFSDQEREQLEAAGYILAATSRRRLQHERYLTYLAVTRASEYLWISHPTADSKGRALFPSVIVSRMRQLVPTISPESTGENAGQPLDGIVTRRQLVSRVAAALRARPDDSYWLDVYEWIVTHPRMRPTAVPLLEALTYSNAVEPLPPELAKALYGEMLRTSVTRLERYAACGFQHFAADGLRLQERQVKRLDPGRLGTLSHEVLRTFIAEIEQEGISWAQLTPENAVERVDRIIDEALASLQSHRHVDTGRDRYLMESTRRTLRMAAQVIVEQMQAGRFRPVAVEAGFGRRGDSMPPWRPEGVGDVKLELRGVIDRIDRAEIDGETFVRIIDYKSRKRKLYPADVLHGMDLQLVLYLAVATADGSRPAGAFYMPVMWPTVRRNQRLQPEEIWAEQKKEVRAQGFLAADTTVAHAMDRNVAPRQASLLFPFELKKDGEFSARSSVIEPKNLTALLTLAQRRAAQMAAEILQGEHRLRPFRRSDGTRACTFCPYHAVCRFDILIPGSEYRVLPSLRDEVVWRIIHDELGDEPDHGASAAQAQSARAARTEVESEQ